MLVVADTGSGAVVLIIFLLLPPALVMLFATYGRSYVISENLITKINHITAKKESAYISAIGGVQIKPIAYGYGHVILTLAGGHKLKIKNIKLPSKYEQDCFITANSEKGLFQPKTKNQAPYDIK